LGHNILGLEDDLKGIVQDDIKTFISQHYATSKMVIGIAGDYDEKKVLKLVNKLFGQVKVYEWDHVREEVSFLAGTQVELQRPINQVHCVLGSTAYSIYDDRKTGLLLLNSLLGGFGMASILNLNIREKYGIAYTIESNYSLYSDTGLFSIYFGTD